MEAPNAPDVLQLLIRPLCPHAAPVPDLATIFDTCDLSRLSDMIAQHRRQAEALEMLATTIDVWRQTQSHRRLAGPGRGLAVAIIAEKLLAALKRHDPGARGAWVRVDALADSTSVPPETIVDVARADRRFDVGDSSRTVRLARLKPPKPAPPATPPDQAPANQVGAAGDQAETPRLPLFSEPVAAASATSQETP